MRLTDEEKQPFHKMREVSELRTQFQCEYRLLLKQRFGPSLSQARVAGIELHKHISVQQDQQCLEKKESRLLPLLIFLVTLIAGILWILG